MLVGGDDLVPWDEATVPFNDSVLHFDLSVLEMVPNVEGDPLRVVVGQVFLGDLIGAHRECC